MIFNRLHPRILVAILKSRLRGKYNKGGNLFLRLARSMNRGVYET